MAGIVAYYYVGSSGGFMGSDGLAGKDLEIRVGAANREWLEASYTTYTFKPISLKLKSFVPYGPGDKDTLRIAMILFASNLFESCPSFDIVKKEMDQIEFIDFNAGRNIPEHFDQLLEESRSVDISGKADIYLAKLTRVEI